MGRGLFDSAKVGTPLPHRTRGDLPHNRGGVSSKLAIMCKGSGDREAE
jgi:hypothetical protein